MDKQTHLFLLTNVSKRPPLQELACSLKKTNPTVSLGVLSVEGDLSSATENTVAQIADLIYVDNITFSSLKGDGRYASKLLSIHSTNTMGC